jgi:two-component system, LuxR family, response regulator FixJ
MDGVELIAQRWRQSMPSPVIVLTGNADVPLAVQAMKLGARDLPIKPLNADAFRK